MTWAAAQESLNAGFMATFGEAVTIAETGEIVTGAFDRPEQSGEHFGVPGPNVEPELMISDADAVRVPAGTVLNIRGVEYTAADPRDTRDGLVRLRLARYG